MTSQSLYAERSRAVDAVTALVEHLTALLVCADILAAQGHDAAAGEVRRALMRVTTALHALREELVTIEIVEHYLRAHEGERERPPPTRLPQTAAPTQKPDASRASIREKDNEPRRVESRRRNMQREHETQRAWCRSGRGTLPRVPTHLRRVIGRSTACWFADRAGG